MEELPRVLAVSALPPWPLHNGYRLRVWELLRELAPRFPVALLAPPPEASVDLFHELGISHYSPLPVQDEQVSYVATGRRAEADVRESLAAAVAEQRPDVLLLWAGTEFAALGHPDWPPVVVDRIDCAALTYWRALGRTRGVLAGAGDFWAASCYERKLARHFNTLVVVAEDDAAMLRRLAPRARVRVIPNGVRLPEIAAGDHETPFPTVTFTGVLSYAPNIDAVLYFARAVWPRVREQMPQAEFVIAGRQPVPEIMRLADEPGICVYPDASSMAELLTQTWIAVAPMRIGAGIKNKVLEAWAHAKPVVLSRLAARGFQRGEYLESLIAQDTAALVECVLDLLRSNARRHELGRRCRELATQWHNWPRFGERMAELLRATWRLRLLSARGNFSE